eukprot:m.429995 g.429995  ORF g.429995 m.429995 type:complete len:202 (+) comp17104_c0_seq1:3791-4396(+)
MRPQTGRGCSLCVRTLWNTSGCPILVHAVLVAPVLEIGGLGALQSTAPPRRDKAECDTAVVGHCKATRRTVFDRVSNNRVLRTRDLGVGEDVLEIFERVARNTHTRRRLLVANRVSVVHTVAAVRFGMNVPTIPVKSHTSALQKARSQSLAELDSQARVSKSNALTLTLDYVGSTALAQSVQPASLEYGIRLLFTELIGKK